MRHAAAVARSDASAPPRSQSSRWNDLAIFAAIAAIAFAVRYLYLLQARAVPLFNALLMDGQSYGEWSDRIVAGDWLGDRIFYQAPLYPYFLALVKLAFGRDLWTIRLVQIALGALSCGVLFLAGKEFFSRRVGIVAGVMLALYPPAIFFDGLIQKANLGLVWIVLLSWWLARARGRPSFARWFAAGTALGLLMLTREETILLVPVLSLSVLLAFRAQPIAARLRWLAGWIAGLALVLLPVGVRNDVVGGEFVLTTSQAGSNFFIGNNPNATGVYAPLRPGRSNTAYERQDATDLAQEAVGHALTPSEVSHYWFARSFDFIRKEPRAWIGQLLHKADLLINSYELPDAEDMYFYAKYSSLLRGLGFVLGYGIVLPLAAAGIVSTWSRRRELAMLYAMLATLGLSVVIFYVFARYRYPIVPILVLFASAALVEAVALVRARRFGPLIGAGLAFAITATLSNRTLFDEDFQLPQAHSNAGVALAMQGDDEGAVREFKRSLELKGDAPEVYGNLGVSLERLKRIDEAIDAYRKALELRPDDARGELRLGSALAKKGDTGRALEHLQRATSLAPSNVEAWNHLADAFFSARRYAPAVEALRKSVALAPQDLVTASKLAWILATAADPTARDGQAAVELARGIEQKKREDVGTLEILAAALAESGRFDEAVATANQALAIASMQKNAALVREIESQLALYRQGKPFHQSK